MAAGTLSRVANIIRADMDDLLCRMEDPDKMARLMMTEMENAVNDAVAAVADAMAGQRLLERRVKARRADAAGWDGTAERAVSRGDDDLARLALERKAAIEAEAEGLEKALDEAGKVTAQLERQCARLKDRFQEARSRRENPCRQEPRGWKLRFSRRFPRPDSRRGVRAVRRVLPAG